MTTVRTRCQAWILAVVVLLPFAVGESRAQSVGGHHSGSVRVLAQDESGLTLEVDDIQPEMRRVGDSTVLEHNVRRWLQQDDYSLPTVAITVGVPYDASSITASLTSSTDSIRWLPLPSHLINARSDGPLASIAAGGILRGLRTVVVRLRPFSIAGGRLAVHPSMIVRVTWKRDVAAAAALAAVASEHPLVERIMADAVVNYDAAKRWRRRSTAARAEASILRADGWGMGTAAVIAVADDEIVRVTGAMLASAGAGDVLGTSISALSLASSGAAVAFDVEDGGTPGIFDAQDAIVFAGKRFRSPEGFYYDETTDTNAYVLRWDASRTPTRLGASTSTGGTTIESVDTVLHFERDLIYHPGDALSQEDGGEIATGHVCERVFGERYYWQRIDNQKEEFQDQIDFFCSPRYQRNDAVKLRIRFHGTVHSANHTVQIILNTYTVVDAAATIAPLADTVLEYLIPSKWLINGHNTLSIAANTDPTIPREVMLDYFELEGRFRMSTFDANPKVLIPADAGPGPYRITLDGLRAPVDRAVSPTHVASIAKNTRGMLVRTASRQFGAWPTDATRENSGFCIDWGEATSQRLRTKQWQAGIELAELDPSTGTLVRSNYFETDIETQSAEARIAAWQAASAFVQSVESGHVLVAGSVVGLGIMDDGGPIDDAYGVFRSRLVQLGSTMLSSRSDAQLRAASWSFAVRKGDPSTAVEAFQTLGQNTNGVGFNAFFPDPNGLYYRAEMTLDGAPGEEYQLGTQMPPAGVRFHDDDALIASDNQADMVIITHPDFRADAERLAEHRRTHDGLNTRVVDVTRIYDEFNHGVKSQDALRHFLQYADSNWTSPTPAFVVLLGDASTDPMRRMGASTMQDFVPSYGNPASDYFLTIAYGDTTWAWHQMIGRLPAKSPAESAAMVDKLIEYDGLPPGEWNKRFVFLSGGANQQELDYNRNYYDYIAEQYITAPNFLGDTASVWRTSTDLNLPDQKDAEAAQRAIDRGTSWVSFSGHGSANKIDLDFGYPADFDIGDHYFVLGAYSCLTGSFALPTEVARNEQFMTARGRGAIAAIGATGFSSPDLNQQLQSNMFSHLTVDFIGNLGAVFTDAKYEAFGHADTNAAPIFGHRIRNHLLMYALLGDPSMTLAIRSTVELAIPEQTVAIATSDGRPPTPEDSSVVVQARVWNFGRPIAPDGRVVVRATIVAPDRSEASLLDTVDVRRFTDVTFELPLAGRPGEYTVRIEADPDGRYEESDEDDNVTTSRLLVRGNQMLPIEPLAYGRVESYDDIEIDLLNPESGPGADIFIDTTADFTSPVLISNATTGTMQLDELTTVWRLSIPQGWRSAHTFWYRAIATTGDPEVARLFPLIESFTIAPKDTDQHIVSGKGQLSELSRVGLVQDSIGLGAGSRNVTIDVTSVGQTFKDLNNQVSADPHVTFRIDDASAVPGGFEGFDGLHVVVLDPEQLTLLRSGYFVFYGSDADLQQQRFVSFVRDSIDEGEVVLVGVRGRSFDGIGGPNGQAVVDALRALGASVSGERLGPEDSYAMIGGKGRPVIEDWVRADSLRALDSVPPFLAEVHASLPVVPAAGSAFTTTIGPALAWHRATLDYAGPAPRLTVRGVRRDGRRDTLITDVRATADLSGIDAATYPRLEIAIGFDADTTQRLEGLRVSFDPSAELALVPSTVRMKPDSVLQGDRASLEFTVANLSRSFPADGVGAHLILLGEGGNQIIDSTLIEHIGPAERLDRSFSIATDGLIGQRSFSVVLNADDLPPEPYRTNNDRPATLRIGRDGVSPSVAFFAEGHRLMDGDYVNPATTFEVRLFDNSQLTIDSTSIERVILDNQVIHAGDGRFQIASEGSYRASFFFEPLEPLDDGTHWMEAITVDASGNRDTSELTFEIAHDFQLAQVVNHPNPMTTSTQFTFMLGGTRPPTGGEIGIYTISGRKIRTIRLSPVDLKIGFNRIPWDGLDEDRDRLANGVYLYRIRIDDGENTVEALEKLAILR